MRGILLISLFIIPLSISGQPYQKLVREGIYWDQFYWDTSTICSTVAGDRVFLKGDTLLNGTTYKKIYSYSILAINQPGPFCPPFGVDTSQTYLNTSYALREDTIDRKVYIYDYFFQAETILFDYNLQVGDTFISQYTTDSKPFIIDSIKIVTTYDGVDRKIFYGNQFGISLVKYLIEGIGSSSGLYTILFDAIGFGSSLACVIDDTLSIYPISNPPSYCIPIVSLEENDPTQNIKLFPNPSTGIISIKHDLIKKSEFYVYDSTGKLIIAHSLNINQHTINLSNLNPGLYFIEIVTENKRVYFNKISLLKY